MNLLVLNRWPQYPDTQRWDNSLARLDLVLPTNRVRISYLCDQTGLQGLPADAEDIHVVDDFADQKPLVELAESIQAKRGPFDMVVAFSEYLLDSAAWIRQRCGIAGQQPQDLERFRNKHVMKKILKTAGIRVPRWSLCRNLQQVLNDAESIGFPLIFKPLRGASCEDVHKIDDSTELEALWGTGSLDGYEIEEYIEGQLLHADGVMGRDGCLYMSISRYTSPCLAFENGSALGSVIQTDRIVKTRCEAFALGVLNALNLRESAFHLEFFDTGGELVFLEIGARVAGADVPYILHDVHGVNLFQLWMDVQLGRERQPIAYDAATSGGWLMIPRPRPLPQQVIAATSLTGKIPFLYRQLIPEAGQILRQAGGYANLQGGRFLFRGGDQREIENSMQAAQAAYRLETVPWSDEMQSPLKPRQSGRQREYG